MPRTRNKKEASEYHTCTWHYEDPKFGGPYCKKPQYGDFFMSDKWPTTQNKQEVTCKNCLKRLEEEEPKDDTKSVHSS